MGETERIRVFGGKSVRRLMRSTSSSSSISSGGGLVRLFWVCLALVYLGRVVSGVR
jgi:hypothetical protein